MLPQELGSRLVLVIDDAFVAEDHLRSLLGPSGPDVEAHRQQTRSSRLRWMARRERGSSAVPLGDQFRRAQVAVAQLVRSTADLTASINADDVPSPAARDLAAGVASIGLADLEAALAQAREASGGTPRTIVTQVLHVVRDVAGILDRAKVRLVLERDRCT